MLAVLEIIVETMIKSLSGKYLKCFLQNLREFL
jgi:hypothetical protein